MSRKRKIAITLAILFVIVLVYGWFRFAVPLRYAVDIGAGMLAKQVCSCVYVAERELADCRADERAMTDPIQVEVLREENRVRAWITGLAERTAIYREGLGCSLE